LIPHQKLTQLISWSIRVRILDSEYYRCLEKCCQGILKYRDLPFGWRESGLLRIGINLFILGVTSKTSFLEQTCQALGACRNGLNMTTSWIKLLDWPSDAIEIGTLIRFPSVEFETDSLVCMICGALRYLIAAEVYIIAGDSAGALAFHIPVIDRKKECSISKKWLIDNWNGTYKVKGDVSEVYLANASVLRIVC
jgi:hypothetical protein